MTLRRASTLLSLVGAALLVAGVAYALFAPLGVEASVTSTGAGTVTTEHRVTLWQHDHEAAVFVLRGAIGIAVVGVALIRFGRMAGPILVGVVCPLVTLASILTIGIFVAPGAAILTAAAALALGDRLERRAKRRSARRLPPPPLPSMSGANPTS